MAIASDMEGRPRASARPTGLTVEVAAYAGLFALALVVRLAALGRWPLLPEGVGTALAALRGARGEAWQPDAYVPLLYGVQRALFALVGPSDAAARLLPALTGAGLAWLPFLVRDSLGRIGALTAAGLLALAPAWVFFSRTADWPILSALCGGVLFAALWRHARTRDPGALRVGAVALGLGLTAGPGIYTVLLGLGAMALVGGAWGSVGDVPDGRAFLRGLGDRTNLRLLAGAFLLAGSAALLHPNGVAESVEWAGRWVQRLRPARAAVDGWYLPGTLLAYEPLTLALALAGATWGILRRNALEVGLAAWALLALLLGSLLGHREPVWLLDALLPLVLLAGRGAQRAWDALRPGFRPADGLALYGALLVVGFGLLALARYVRVADDTWRAYALLTAGALVVAWAAYWLWAGEQGLRVGVLAALVLLGGITVRSTVALAYQTGRDPREPIVLDPPSTQLRDLQALAASTAAHLATDRQALTIEYDPALDPWLGWYLRAYPQASVAPAVRVDPPESTVLIRRGAPEEDWPAGYLGQAFRLREHWRWATAGVPWHDRLRWFLYRDPVGVEEAETIRFWVRPPAR